MVLWYLPRKEVAAAASVYYLRFYGRKDFNASFGLEAHLRSSSAKEYLRVYTTPGGSDVRSTRTVALLSKDRYVTLTVMGLLLL